MNNFLKSVLMLLVLCVQSPAKVNNWTPEARSGYCEAFQGLSEKFLSNYQPMPGQPSKMQLEYMIESILESVHKGPDDCRALYSIEESFFRAGTLEAFINYVQAVHNKLFPRVSSERNSVSQTGIKVRNISKEGLFRR